MIEVENLSKKYRRGAQKQTAASVRESLANLLSGKLILRRKNNRKNEFYALRDINFTAQAGEVVGIIGRNGAGKSTLLKIMSQIVFPDAGSVTLRGRVGSMLEIGAGFNQELTGRENVFLSGAILGMSNGEIRQKFGKIIEFSGVENFLDVPVKRYSSGMYLRLAFAVAAHLEPEIIFLDEILGVGDFEFQQRCLGKIRELSQTEGRTILTVSHNLTTIESLCARTIWLDHGRLKMDGETAAVVAAYKDSATQNGFYNSPADSPEQSTGSEYAKLISIRALNKDGQTIETVDVSEEFAVEIEYEVFADDHVLIARLEFCNEIGACLFWTLENDSQWRNRARAAGRYASCVRVPGNLLNQGNLSIGAAMYSIAPWFGVNFQVQNAINLQVTDDETRGAARGAYPAHIPGFLRPRLDWDSRKI